jgi:hypothetical protein
MNFVIGAGEVGVLCTLITGAFGALWWALMRSHEREITSLNDSLKQERVDNAAYRDLIFRALVPTTDRAVRVAERVGSAVGSALENQL